MTPRPVQQPCYGDYWVRSAPGDRRVVAGPEGGRRPPAGPALSSQRNSSPRRPRSAIQRTLLGHSRIQPFGLVEGLRPASSRLGRAGWVDGDRRSVVRSWWLLVLQLPQGRRRGRRALRLPVPTVPSGRCQLTRPAWCKPRPRRLLPTWAGRWTGCPIYRSPNSGALFDSLHLGIMFQPGEHAVDVEVTLAADEPPDPDNRVSEVWSVPPAGLEPATPLLRRRSRPAPMSSAVAGCAGQARCVVDRC
jgi:hypothetical protein